MIARCRGCGIPLPHDWLARCEFCRRIVDYPAIVRDYYAESYPAEWRPSDLTVRPQLLLT